MDTRFNNTADISIIVSSFAFDILSKRSGSYGTTTACSCINVIFTGRLSDCSLTFASLDIHMTYAADSAAAGNHNLVTLGHCVFNAGISINRQCRFIISICQNFQIQRRIDTAAVRTCIQVNIISTFQIRITGDFQLIAALQTVFSLGRGSSDRSTLCIGDSLQPDFSIIAGR